jgi:hypothetical protein
MPTGASRAQNVIDLVEWRATHHPEPIPQELLNELDAAGRVYDALLAQGHEVRFDVPGHGGRVRAELRSVAGEVVRAVSLGEVVGFEDPTAA